MHPIPTVLQRHGVELVSLRFFLSHRFPIRAPQELKLLFDFPSINTVTFSASIANNCEIELHSEHSMVKLLSFIAISGGMATTSAKGGIRLQSIVKRNTYRLDDMTTKDLELATRQFVASNIDQIQIMNNRYHDDKGSRRLDSEQPSTRNERTSKHVSNWSSGKSGKDSSTVAGITSEEVSNSWNIVLAPLLNSLVTSTEHTISL